MNVRSLVLATVAAVSLASCNKAASPESVAPLKLSASIDFPGYTGDFDMFEIDPKNGRLLLAGEEFHELEVMDLQSGAIQRRISGFGVPHSVHYIADTNEVLVIDGEKASPVYDAASWTVKRAFRLPAGADTFGNDPASGHIWLTSGGKDVPQKDSYITEMDPKTGKALTTIHLDSDHVETMAVEQNGPHIFVNLTDKNTVAVIDHKSGKIVTQWPINGAEQNAPMAMDELNHRLFVVTRKPGMLFILNSESGSVVASFAAPLRCDQVIWDAANRRIYVTGGEGYISVFEQDDADHYREVAKVPSMAGAKTAILDAANRHLWVAASPGESSAMGKVLRFDVVAR